MLKILKYFMSFLLVAGLCVPCFVSVDAADDSSLVLTVNSEQAVAGETFDVTVAVTSNPGVIALRLLIEYDADVLTLVNAVDTALLGTGTLEDVYSSPYKAVWVDSTAAANITATGDLLVLTFKAADVTDVTAAPVTVRLASANDCLDKDLNKVNVQVNGGSDITVSPTPVIKGDLNDDGAVDGDDAIYALYHTLYGETDYPLNQSIDFDGNGSVDGDDAVYLLYYSLFGDQFYPLS